MTYLIGFWDGLTGWVDEMKVVDVVYLDFSKGFNTVLPDILMDKIRKSGLNE